MINKYLYELLKINSRVIIPDFGAFLVKEKPGGKMEVSYNDFLKFNDGLLINKIIKTESVSKTDATKKVKEYINEIEETFKKGERYKLEFIGEFYKDDYNRVKFDPFKEDQPAVSGEQKTEAEKVEVKAEVKKEAPKTEIKEEPKDEAKKEVKPEVKDPGKKEEVNLASQITAKINKEPEKKVDVKPPQQAVPGSAKAKKPVTAKKQNGSKTLIWVSGVVVVIAALITWAVLDYDRISGWFGNEDTTVVDALEKEAKQNLVAQDAPKVTAEEIKDEPEAVEEKPIVKEQKPEAKKQTTYTGAKYYVVAGSFKVESNAIKLAKKLKAEGYNAENLGLINGFHIVTFDGFPDLQSATKLWKMVKADQPDTWVLKY